MTPPCYTFPAAELPERVLLDVHGRQRKMPYSELPAAALSLPTPGAGQVQGVHDKPQAPSASRHSSIDLVRDCELLSSMVQYSCAVMHPEMRGSPIRCWPVQRLFRRCQDRSGSFTVETTAWENAHGTEPLSVSGSTVSKASPSAS